MAGTTVEQPVAPAPSHATNQPVRPLVRYGALIAGLAALALFLAYADNNFNGYRLQVLTLIALNSIVAVSLALTSGFTGVFSLGQMGFYAIGAYVGAILAIPPQWKDERVLPGLPGWLAGIDLTGLHPQVALLIACLGGGAVAAVIAAIVGAPLMRLSGHYVAVATMGFLIIVNSVLINWNDVTRGARGMNQIPTTTNIWVAFAWALVTLYVVLRIKFSASGRSMIASRENIIAARAAGIPVLQTRLLAFVVGAFFTGAAGALLAHQLGHDHPARLLLHPDLQRDCHGRSGWDGQCDRGRRWGGLHDPGSGSVARRRGRLHAWADLGWRPLRFVPDHPGYRLRAGDDLSPQRPVW